MTGSRSFIVRAEQTLRGSPPEDNVFVLTTAVNSGLCGVELDLDTVYLFALPGFQPGCGPISANIGSCDAFFAWDRLADDVRQFASSGDDGCSKMGISPLPTLPPVAVFPTPPLTLLPAPQPTNLISPVGAPKTIDTDFSTEFLQPSPWPYDGGPEESRSPMMLEPEPSVAPYIAE